MLILINDVDNYIWSWYTVIDDIGNASLLRGIKMTVQNLIEKYRLTLHGSDMVRFTRKPTAKDLAEMKAKKAEIIVELKRLEIERHNQMLERERAWAEKRAQQAAADQIEIEKMRLEADALRKQIPADHVEVTVTKVGDADGHPILRYTVSQFELSWTDVNTIGAACAIRPGAMGAFAEVYVASIPAAKLAELKAAKEAEKDAAVKRAAEAIAKKEAAFAEAAETGKPVELSRTTEPCDGSAYECSLDIVVRYAMPDGAIKAKRIHTH